MSIGKENLLDSTSNTSMLQKWNRNIKKKNIIVKIIIDSLVRAKFKVYSLFL